MSGGFDYILKILNKLNTLIQIQGSTDVSLMCLYNEYLLSVSEKGYNEAS